MIISGIFLRFLKLNALCMTAFIDLSIKLAYKLKNPKICKILQPDEKNKHLKRSLKWHVQAADCRPS